MKDKVKYILELPIQEAKKQINEDCDILGLKFTEDIEKGIEAFKELLPFIDKPLMLIGSGDDEIDSKLLPGLMKLIDRECIIGIANEKNLTAPDSYPSDYVFRSDSRTAGCGGACGQFDSSCIRKGTGSPESTRGVDRDQCGKNGACFSSAIGKMDAGQIHDHSTGKRTPQI